MYGLPRVEIDFEALPQRLTAELRGADDDAPMVRRMERLGRLLLNFWNVLASHVFANGYQVGNYFADLAAQGSTPASPQAHHPVRPYQPRDSLYASDLTASSFRLYEVILLFKKSLYNVENVLNFRKQFFVTCRTSRRICFLSSLSLWQTRGTYHNPHNITKKKKRILKESRKK
ncbi:hypothetical protein STCU_11830 [Strigomonas culicis]|uniref:Uncharacterized protein n=1 Tax=Strigomonas culicis TaxID=28005 RepID=S9TFI2_9TRYP|nr:hypothetical protein STCU_11830 [Strigomonas culicis]|eukprot:EPY15694.1 hypothetical protein STCU_11830 [Strigomonas culicis]